MSKAITIRLDDKIYEQLAAQAKAAQRSLANFVQFEILSYAHDNPFERQKNLLAAMNQARGVWANRSDLVDTEAYLDQLRGRRSFSDIKAKRLKALDKLSGLWKDHPVKSPEKYVRALRSSGRAKRLGLL